MEKYRLDGIDSRSLNYRGRGVVTYKRRVLTVTGRRSTSTDGFLSVSSNQEKAVPLVIEKLDLTSRRLHNYSPAKTVAPRQTKSLVLRRDAVKVQPLMGLLAKSASRKHKTTKTAKSMIAMAVLLFMAGVTVTVVSYRNNYKVIGQVSALSQTANTSTSSDETVAPSETAIPPSSIDSYQVAADLPRLIRIPSIALAARIFRLGVDNNNQLKVPNNTSDVGWYDGSAKPGEAGAMLLDGHVSGPVKAGIFYNLHKLTAGDAIQIERGDSKVLNFKVVKVQSYDAATVDMAAALTPINTTKSGLNLITCTGQYNAKTGHFADRLVVFAEEQNP